jgi:polysaccharide export outer membrane protein
MTSDLPARLLRLFAALLLALGPLAPVAAQDDYKLGAGDVLRVTVYDNPDLLTDVEIAESGTVTMPLLGAVAVLGKTREQAAQTIADGLKRGGFLKEAKVMVRVLEYRSQQVAVLGEVAKPGRYAISRPSSVAEMIGIAGGITAKGSQLVTVTQAGAKGEAKRVEVNLNDQIAASGDKVLLLRAGDTVFVPGAPQFFIYGEVRQPGAYVLAPGMTVAQALSLGGGLTQRGTERGIRVERRTSDGSVKTYNIRGQDPLQANDVLRVPESWF